MMTDTYGLNCDGCGRVYCSEEAFPKPQYCPDCSVVYRAGIKEVVEWAEANLTYPTRGEGICFERNLEWQAKLKEWGC